MATEFKDLKEGVRNTISVPLPEENGKVFLILKPKRILDNPYGCLQLYIKAPIFEEFFSSICPDRGILITEQDIKNYCLPMEKAFTPEGNIIWQRRLTKAMDYMSGKYNDDIMLADFSTPNMSILTAVGIKDGINFVFPGLYTEQAINNAIKNFYNRAVSIHKTYIKQCTVKYEVYTREVE